MFGGQPGTLTATESYNGNSWTTVNSMNTARSSLGTSGVGTQTATLGFGGNPGSPPFNTTATESWNGSTWTSVNSMNTARNSPGVLVFKQRLYLLVHQQLT
jgi:hypothetical protein